MVRFLNFLNLQLCSKIVLILVPGTLTIKNDPRILPVGKLLRKTKINELPQLLNIFFGDMSLIGPRPLAIQNFNSYSKFKILLHW